MSDSIQSADRGGLLLCLERTLVLAPHPDDDVIAAGGLIQRVVASGGDLRVLFVTDGENNPWPMRWNEKKWSIKASDRAAWGARRREEARRSLARLGVPAGNASFLALPDHQITAGVRAGDSRLSDSIGRTIAEFRPTLIVAPSTRDLHPDHRAIGSAAHRAAAGAPVITYIVHGTMDDDHLAARIELTPGEQRRKRAAIECHESQLLLSRDRFLAFAQNEECFYRSEPIRAESMGRERLTIIRHSLRAFLATFPLLPSGIQPTADIQDRPGDVPGLL